MPPKGQLGPSQIPITQTKSSGISAEDLRKTYGATGTPLLHGFIEEEYNTSLQGGQGLEKYDKMRRSDAQVQATLLVMELPIRSTRWYIEPARDENDEVTPEAEEHAQFVERALFDCMEQTWDDYLREILTMLPFGFYVGEKVYTADDEHVWIKKIEYRKQTTILKWQQENGEPGVTQFLPQPLLSDIDSPNEGKHMVSIPEEKLLILTFRREGDNMRGIPVLRSAYKHWYTKENLYKFDAVRHEKQSVGIPVLTLPEGATQQDEDKAQLILERLRANEQSGVVLPNNKWKFEFADLKVHTQSDLWKSIDHHNRQISKNVLAQFMDLASGDGGSYALSEDQSDFFLLALEAIANQIGNAHDRYVIPELIDLNFDDVERYPRLRHDRMGNVDYSTIATVLSTLADKGVIGVDRELEDWTRQQLGLPAKVDEEVDGEKPEPKKKKEPKNPDEPNKPNGDDVPEEEEEPVNAHEQLYGIYSKFVNNRVISKLQGQVQKESLPEVKKKGFVLNEYEKRAWRPLTFAERKINLTSLKKAINEHNEKIEGKVGEITGKQKEDLLKQVKRAVENDDIKAVGKIKAKYTGDLSKALTDVQKEMFDFGKQTAAAEMAVKVPPTSKEIAGVMRVGNDQVVESFVGDLEGATKEAVASMAAKRGGTLKGVTAAEAVGVVDEAVDKVIKKAASMKTISVVGALNLGRSTIFERYPEKVYAMQYSAILDDRTTDHCLSLDGRIVKPGSPQFYKYSPPQHFNCRSIWVEILMDEEFKPTIDGIPSSIKPTQGVSSFDPPLVPIVKKGSAATKVIEQEISQRQAKIDQYKADGKYANRQAQHQTRIDNLRNALGFNEEWVVEYEYVDSDIQSIFFERLKDRLEDGGVKFA